MPGLSRSTVGRGAIAAERLTSLGGPFAEPVSDDPASEAAGGGHGEPGDPARGPQRRRRPVSDQHLVEAGDPGSHQTQRAVLWRARAYCLLDYDNRTSDCELCWVGWRRRERHPHNFRLLSLEAPFRTTASSGRQGGHKVAAFSSCPDRSGGAGADGPIMVSPPRPMGGGGTCWQGVGTSYA